MDDIAAQLSQILADPAQMAQIMQLAGSLGLGGEAPKAGAEEPSGAGAAAPSGSSPMADALGFDPAALGRLLPLLQQAGGREARVFAALRPYLSAEDQHRADRALRAAKLSRLASAAMKEMEHGNLGGLL